MQHRSSWLVAGAAALAAASVVGTPTEAKACGGCFAPETTTAVITGHRMAVSLSASETTLWDQFEYAGNPEDFVWVLPVDGDVGAELADNAFFQALDQLTEPDLRAAFPPLEPCSCGGAAEDAGAGSDAGFSGARRDAGGPPPVMVLREETVGPYETVVIRSTDSNALLNWLNARGYRVVRGFLPVIQHYVDRGLDFLALRLAPDAGVSQMQPVRVTTPGMNPIFPLRMVGAGVVESVELQLFVIGEGRYEANNFPTVEVDRAAVTWDWNLLGYNYDALFAEAISGAGDRGWVAEYAGGLDPSSYRERDPVTGDIHTPMADWAVASRDLATPYVTRLRTKLLAAHLDQDIVLQADLTRGDLGNVIYVEREVNRPTCETRCGGTPPGTDPPGTDPPGTPPGADPEASSGGFCSAAARHRSGTTALLGLLLAALALLARRR